MSEQHDEPTTLDATLASQIHTARLRGAYSTETLAALAHVDPEVIAGLEHGTPITDATARDRIMNVLGLRPAVTTHRRSRPA